MVMNFQALRYFEMVARHEHITKAANELFISQSTLSKAIDNLERDIGVKLFEKNGRNIQLTSYGKILRDYVQRGFEEMECGIQRVQLMANERSGTVRIATVYSGGSFILPQYIKGFSNQYPDIHFNYHQKPTYRILDDMLQGELDIGFCSNYEEREEYADICREELLTEELCLIVPDSHPLASRQFVDFKEVLDETWIGYNGDTGMATAILNISKAAGFKKKFRFSYFASEESAVIGLVRAGLGVSIIPVNSYVAFDDVKKIKISKPYFYRSMYMIWNKKKYLSPPAKAFRKYILSIV